MRLSTGTEKRTVFPSHTGPSVAPLKGPAMSSNFQSVVICYCSLTLALSQRDPEGEGIYFFLSLREDEGESFHDQECRASFRPGHPEYRASPDTHNCAM